MRRQWRHGPPRQEDGEREIQALARALEQIDSTCLGYEDGYWPAWLDDLRTL